MNLRSYQFLLATCLVALAFENCTDIRLIKQAGDSAPLTMVPPLPPPPPVESVTYTDACSADGAAGWGGGSGLSRGVPGNLPSLSSIYPDNSSVLIDGTAHPLTIITGGNDNCGSIANFLYPLPYLQKQIAIGTSKGVYAFRFHTPAEAFVSQFSFLVYSGIYQNGSAWSISKLPGDIHSTTGDSTDYCVGGGSSAVTTGIIDVKSAADPNVKSGGKCAVSLDSDYYYNVVIDSPDPTLDSNLNNSLLIVDTSRPQVKQ